MDVPVLDKCPGYNLYIGGFIALRRPKALKNSRITHIVSVLDWQFEKDTPLIQGYQHLHIPVDDVEDENLLEWFPRSNAFIHLGLNYWRTNQDASQHPVFTSDSISNDPEKGSGVLIHCAMGKSRSATVLIAYLLWASRQTPPSASTSSSSAQDSNDMVSLPPRPLSVVEALTLLRQGRPIAEPNEGFMDQLHLYADMGCPTTQTQLEAHKLYRRWMNRRNVLESLRINRAPEMADIIFEDDNDGDDGDEKAEHQESIAPGVSAPDGTASTPRANSLATSPNNSTGAQIELKCRKCRRLLARSAFIYPHSPPGHRDPSVSTSDQCAHVFLHPLSWMKPALSAGDLDGRLTCPNEKCGANIGKFAWQGLRCSCGGWVTPGFGVGRAKVDEVVVRKAGRTEGLGQGGNLNGSVGGGALRLPPGMRKGNL